MGLALSFRELQTGQTSRRSQVSMASNSIDSVAWYVSHLRLVRNSSRRMFVVIRSKAKETLTEGFHVTSVIGPQRTGKSTVASFLANELHTARFPTPGMDRFCHSSSGSLFVDGEGQFSVLE